MSLGEDLAADIEAHLPPDRRGGPTRTRWRRRLAIVARSEGFHLLLLHRSSHVLRGRGGWPGRIVAAALAWLARRAFGCSIAPAARLGGGLILPHPQGIVIGPGTEIGPRAWIFQNVTIGGAPGLEGEPRIGADARIYPGAVLAGPISIGVNVVIGANAVVLADIPDRTLVRSPFAEAVPLPDRLRVDF